MTFSAAAPPPFEWRAATGRWRWLMLGTLGVAASGCWGEVLEEETGTERSPGSPGTDTSSTLGTSTTSGTSTISRPLPERAPGSECRNGTPLGAGWERCENGLIHRAQQSGECASTLPRPQQISEAVLRVAYPAYDPSSPVRPNSIPCIQDSDCAAQPLGQCEAGGQEGGVYCTYGCKTDADCGAGAVCLCGEPAGSCVASACSTDADCPAGLCASYVSSPGCPSLAFACQTPQDECVVKADCGALTCTVDEYTDGPKHRYCSPDTWDCGRPFLIEGDARRAGCVTRDDWYPARALSGAPAPTPDAELRARVAHGWLDQALMEHASVAAFARFALQLLGLGAPAELLQETSQAMADEIAHARDCFALARRFGDCDRGPALLPLAGALAELDLRSIVLTTILEGCIGETVAAMEAAEALAHCQDSAAHSVLERISADETRHAQLAWRFVAWALERGPSSLRQEVGAAFESVLAGAAAATDVVPLSVSEHELLHYGLVGPELRVALRARVLHEVVSPCARALLCNTPARQPAPSRLHAVV